MGLASLPTMGCVRGERACLYWETLQEVCVLVVCEAGRVSFVFWFSVKYHASNQVPREAKLS